MCRGPEQDVERTERVLQVVVSALDQGLSLGSRKQKSVALSSAEAEYMAASMVACERMWLRKLLVGLFECELEATVVHCDN